MAKCKGQSKVREMEEQLESPQTGSRVTTRKTNDSGESWTQKYLCLINAILKSTDKLCMFFPKHMKPLRAGHTRKAYQQCNGQQCIKRCGIITGPNTLQGKENQLPLHRTARRKPQVLVNIMLNKRNWVQKSIYYLTLFTQSLKVAKRNLWYFCDRSFKWG